jgi:hypothetical protein
VIDLDQPIVDESVDEGLTEVFGFRVVFSAHGRFRGTVYFTADGSFR